MRMPFFLLYALQRWWFPVFLIYATLRGAISIVLICISLIVSDHEHFFTSLLSVLLSSLRKHLFTSFPPLLGLLVFVLLDFVNVLYILDISPLLDEWWVNIFACSVWCLLNFSLSVLCHTQFFSLIYTNVFLLFFDNGIKSLKVHILESSAIIPQFYQF